VGSAILSAVRRRRLPGLCHLGLLAAGLLLASPGLGQGAPDPEPVITAIEMRSDASAEALKELRSMIALTPGEPLREAAVRRTLRNLHATGLIASAAVYTRASEPSGVVAVVVARAAIRIEGIALAGELGLAKDRLLRELVVTPGEALVEDRLLRSVYNLQDLYARTGHPAAQVRLAVDVHRDRAGVTFLLDPGPRLSIGGVAFEGPAGPFTVQQLAEPLEAGPGKPYDARGIREDAERLRRWLVSQGYRTARVEPARETRLGERGEVDLAYRLELGPRVELTVHGADLKRLEHKDLLPLLSVDGYDQALLERTRTVLRQHFQEKGHWHAAVTVEEAVTDETIGITIQIDPGPVYTLETVEFVGNASISAARLTDRMATRPDRWLKLGDGRLSQATLDGDLDNLRSFYILEGFWDVQVGPPEIQETGHKLALIVPVIEGERRRVGDLLLKGVEHLDPTDQALALTPGGPYHPRRLQEAVIQLRSRYQAHGYDAVRVAASQSWVDDHLVDVTLQVLEGPQTVVDRVVLRGNRKTEGPVLRRFIDLDPGEPVSRQRLLEVERNLSRLGIFSSVNVALSPGELGSADRDVVVRVEEGKTRRIAYGLGYDSDNGPRGLLSYAHRNLGGKAFTLQLDTLASTEDQRFRIALNQPSLGHLRIPLTYTLFLFDENRDSFDQTSWGARVEAFRQLPVGRLGLILEHRIINLNNVQVPLNEIEREDREIEIASLIPNYFIDHRNDPFDPSKGWSTLLQTQVAFPAFSTDANFLKLFVQQTGYLDLGNFGVLAGSLRLGAIEPSGSGTAFDNPRDPTQVGNPVPIGERFFAGGRTSHRAYGRDDLGVLDETLLAEVDAEGRTRLIPVGGNALVLANLEYRFPIAGALGGTLFVDVGNVWRDWRGIDLGQSKVGAGLGLRYRSPVGPIRLEVGWKLDRETGESPAQFFLSVGSPF
jgi:outer membrane protein insertion porin family